jgi:hypothetical protein
LLWQLTISSVANPQLSIRTDEDTVVAAAAADSGNLGGKFSLTPEAAVVASNSGGVTSAVPAVTTAAGGNNPNLGNNTAPSITSPAANPAHTSSSSSLQRLLAPFSTATFAGTPQTLSTILSGLSYTAPETAGTRLSNRQTALLFSLSLLREDGTKYSTAEVRTHNPLGTLPCVSAGLCQCLLGWTGAACDRIQGLSIVVTILSADMDSRVVWRSTGRPGPQVALNRGGHGTHTVITAAGAPLVDPSDPPSAGSIADATAIGRASSIAAAARLAVVDIGRTGSQYLTPPASLGEPLMGRPYHIAKARIFLAPWTCEATAVGCGGYGSSAWEVSFLFHHARWSLL